MFVILLYCFKHSNSITLLTQAMSYQSSLKDV